MTMFKSKKSNSKKCVDETKVIRRERQSDDDDKLVITIQDWKTSCVGCISPFDLLTFLGWWFPELFIRLNRSIDEEDWGVLMRLLSTKLAISTLQDFEEELNKELKDKIDED